ncbi:MAG: hypothetical protein MSA90_22125 [Faecalicatena sp.]|uniref:hypothetical protein n=1 Tax=Faecalicatena sp. TaxID=2005360 RepID=UPI00258D2F6A|nr:hypothetical protein [Faecalicatena sp.]MCI6468148.1 hypothetical protein [Faecalicatena sp.]MDY5620402.1 hypothetical protein [Lachnospiraceae bacterium]
MGYIWNFKEDEDLWFNDEHDTVEECLEEARKEAERDEHQAIVFIGECIPYTPEADCTDILDRMQEQAGEMCGEVGGDWCAYKWLKKEELEELNDTLTSAVCDWMKKYGYYPTFYSIQNIREYQL